MKMEDWGIIQAVLPLPWEGGRERLMHSGHVGIPLSDGEGHGIKVIHCHHYTFNWASTLSHHIPWAIHLVTNISQP